MADDRSLTGAERARFQPVDVLRQAQVQDVALAPDGETIVYSRRVIVDGKYRTNLWIVPWSGGAARQLTFAAANDTTPVFSPDGAEIVFISDRGGRKQPWVLPLSGGEARLVIEIETVVLPSKSSQTVELKGDDVVIPNSQITSLALILHEWATNSTKYGAFANEDGKLAVDWSQNGDSVVLDWAEKGRAEIDDGQSQAGFGTRLISTATRQLNGTLTTDQADDTYCMKLEFPLAQAD